LTVQLQVVKNSVLLIVKETAMAYEPLDLSNVKIMLEAYCNELERGGHSEEALQLKGLELFDVSGAHVALATLRSMPNVACIADCVKRNLIQMLQNLLRIQQLAA
jgi:hypothetical protein